MADELDPFTVVYKAIFAGLMAHAELASLIKLGNRVDMTAAQFQYFKEQIQSGDVPELILLQGAFTLEPFGPSSKGTALTQTYPLIITLDNLRLVPLNRIKWEVLRAIVKLGGTLNLPYVQRLSVTGGNDDPFGQPQWKRGQSRWISVVNFVVEMSFPRQLLISPGNF